MSAISFGAGVNSTAMVIWLVNRGWRGPILFADTETEWPDTYCFIDAFERNWLAPRGLEVTRLDGAYRAHVPGRDRRSLIAFCEDYRTTPMAGMRWCTQGWKTDVINHWCAEHGETEQLLGIAADEAHRQKGRLCPLIDAAISRKECVSIIRAEGLPIPRKSSCYICPFQQVEQWRELWRRYPELFARAEHLEALATERRGQQTYLMVSGKVTLAQLRLRFESQMPLFDCDVMEELEAYRPCVCGL